MSSSNTLTSDRANANSENALPLLHFRQPNKVWHIALRVTTKGGIDGSPTIQILFGLPIRIVLVTHMANVLVTCAVERNFKEAILSALGSVATIEFLSDTPTEKRSCVLSNADALICWSLKRELQPKEFETISNVKLLQLISAGADQVPFAQIPPSVEVATNAGAYAEPMAEHILAMVLAINKNLIDRHNKLAHGVFDQFNMNRMLRGSVCAILGFGGIGKATARLLRCFDVSILAINKSGKTDEPVEFIGTLRDLEHVLRLADIIVIALPSTKSTTGIIGEKQLGWMKNNATIVNVARGEIIDEQALFKRLKERHGFNAAIDAWWIEPPRHGKFHINYPFLTLPNVLGSPHNSGVVPNSLIVGGTLAAENVKRFLNHEPVRGIVDRRDYT